MPAKILVVDDEPKIVDLIRKFLVNEGFVVHEAHDGRKALRVLETVDVDLVVLDVMLPGLDGLEVLRQIRGRGDTPVIMLTARSEEVDRVLGLGLGADDYITKPFSLRELTLRIRAVLKRSLGQQLTKERVLAVGDLVLNQDKMEVTIRGLKADLTKAEFHILSALMSRPGKVFTREELLVSAFGEAYPGYDRTVDTHIWGIRRKIEEDPKNPLYVLTVFGVGYKGGTGR